MVVIQSDDVNESGIRTAVMCAFPGNLDRARVPGNVLLDPASRKLSKESVQTPIRVS